MRVETKLGTAKWWAKAGGLLSFASLVVLLGGCCKSKGTPEDTCKRMADLYDAKATGADSEKCIKEMVDLQKKDPVAYACNTECAGKSGDKKEFIDCLLECKPSSTSTGSGAGDGCPGSAACITRCKNECESKHGQMFDNAAGAECVKAGGSAEECVSKTTNLSCRGL
jgi:hypothetical protein